MDAESLLEAAHFSRDGQTGIWRYRKVYMTDDSDRRMVAQVVARPLGDGRYEALIPMQDEQDAEVDAYVLPSRGLRFVTDDARDIVAMALGERALATLEIYGLSSDIGFPDRYETWITMPFNGGTYHDYAIKQTMMKSEIKDLEDPADVFGQAYVEWRDEYCSELLADFDKGPSAVI